ncbi:MAG: ArsC family (seleno)protein [Candidatus Melainabacteria bacterium]|nr:ArsC family (seleno)protein [Candidatus Melainabacteria bacterium]
MAKLNAAIKQNIDWRYHRSGCSTCQKTQDFLDRHGLGAVEMVEAKKKALRAEEALKLAHSVDEIYATKGSNRVFFNLKQDRPGEDSLLASMLGPTGNLRAPILKKGRVLLVGFDEEIYSKILLD